MFYCNKQEEILGPEITLYFILVQKNIGLRKLDISWNGYGKDECYILSQTLKENTTLKELDLSNNRVNKDAIGHLLKALQEGDGLETLRVRYLNTTCVIKLLNKDLYLHLKQLKVTF